MLSPRTRARFWSKVNRSGGPDACWLWTACLNTSGYGRFSLNGRPTGAHRVSWLIEHGHLSVVTSVTDPVCVLHRCDVPACVNPRHLFLGTQHDNCVDREKKGRGGQPKGTRNGRSTYTPELVMQMRRDYANGMSFRQIAKRYGLGHAGVKSAIWGRTWGHIQGTPDAPIASRRRTTITPDIASLIKAAISCGKRSVDIANEFGVGVCTVKGIRWGRTWRDVA